MQCEIDGCDREAKTRRYGNLCLMHYKRFFRHGDNINGMDEAHERRAARERGKCKFCDREVGRTGAFGMCNKHYQMYRNHGDALFYDRKPRSKSNGYYRIGKNGQHEHRKVYEDYYGVKLKPSQVIHHINFDRIDNSIENLWCYNTASEHQRVHAEYRRLRKQYPDENIVFRDGAYHREHE